MPWLNIRLVSPLFSTVKKYERPLSAVSMVAGFIFDNFYFDRVDHPATQIVLAVYLALAVVSIVLIHFVEVRRRAAGPAGEEPSAAGRGDAVRVGRFVERVSDLLRPQRD